MREIRAWKWIVERCRRPWVKAFGWSCYEIAVCFWPYLLGAQMMMDILCKDWRRLGFHACISLLLAVASFRLHHIRRLSLGVRKELNVLLLAGNARLEEENRKLRGVALAAIALEINIEHGVPPNLNALKRELVALRPAGQAEGDEHGKA